VPAALLLAPILIASLACSSGGSSQPASDIVSTIPWGQTESLNYVLHDKSGKQTATGTLSIKVNGAETDLTQDYRTGSSSDVTTVEVDSQTLKPKSSDRAITGTNDDQQIQATYTNDTVVIKQGDKKQSGLTVPEHAYDNDSSLFLWRTIDFHEGYAASYVTIITNRRSRQNVDLKVTGRESVTVPAGQFQAWRLEIKTANANQVAWIADTPARTLVKYDNDNGLIFELQSKP
jgi:hypothetical protein